MVKTKILNISLQKNLPAIWSNHINARWFERKLPGKNQFAMVQASFIWSSLRSCYNIMPAKQTNCSNIVVDKIITLSDTVMCMLYLHNWKKTIQISKT